MGTIVKNSGPAETEYGEHEPEHIKLADIMKLPASYWVLIIVATLS